MKRKHSNKLNNSSECNLLIVKNIPKWHDEQFVRGRGTEQGRSVSTNLMAV